MLFKTIAFTLVAPFLAVSALSIAPRQSPSSSPDLANLTAQFQGYVSGFNQGALVENVFNSTFYSTPSNFSTSLGPGKLLKLEKVSNSSLDVQYGYPAGLTLYRMMYTSMNLANETVPASGFILLPYFASNRTVVWTHGTSGITRDCSPSNWRLLYYDWTALFQLATMGLNVVAPDYAGQGTDTQFDYVAGASHAYDASFALVAARDGLPSVNLDEWAVVGHSEGGLSAWATAEREARSPIGGYLGGVALAPSMDPVDINLRAFATPATRQALTDSGSVFYPVFLLEVIHRLFPSLNPADYLTTTGQILLNLTLSGGCYPAAATYFTTFSLEQVWSGYSWLNSTEAKEWQALTADQGLGKLDKPLLVVQGTGDEAVSPAVNSDTFDHHCRLYPDSPIQYSQYPNYRHGEVVHASGQQWQAFLDDLFSGRKPSNFVNCRSHTLDAFAAGAGMRDRWSTNYSPPM